MFGYVKGAFTDASQDGKKGLFEEANGGTIFLDEITETSVSTQSKLLRVIQEKTIRPVGSNYEIPIDVRIICSTNKNVHTLIDQNTFKKDLFFRINTFSIEVPPLRKRDDDTLLLAAHFLNDSYFHFDDKYVDFLSTYEWPGNVRELKNVIEFSKAMASGDLLTIDLLPEYLKNYANNKLQMTDMTLPSDETPTLKEFTANMEKNYILSLLQKHSNDKAGKDAVAKLLNISLASLYNKIKYNLIRY